MTITLSGTVPITIICNYSPTAKATSEEKQEHYETLKRTQRKHQSKGPTYTIGDFNARIQKKQSESETPIGNHTFDINNPRTEAEEN